MNSVLPASNLPPSLSTPVPSARGAKAAQEFEAQLLGSVLESLEASFAAVPGQDRMAGADEYGYLGTQALSEALAARGGIGIAAIVSRALPLHEGKQP
ncbi:MAG TPA: hypothetical protein VMG31_12920 [Verrucomicrobiae bacterium]|nr:hypothetical protein [Verrucomicrobiae bacterium]